MYSNRGSRDVMGRDESWWQSRTGLEQKLVILSTVLFILSFALTISVIVIKNRSPSAPAAATTVSPVTVTGDATTVSGGPTDSTESTVTEASGSTASTVSEASGSTESTVSAASDSTKSTVTEEASSTATTVTEDASSTASAEAETTTTKEKTLTEKKSDIFASGSINNRPARYISPRALANLNGA